MKAHEVIDPLWKDGKMSRKDMYRMLSEKMGREIHIGESDIETCKEIIKEFQAGNAQKSTSPL